MMRLSIISVISLFLLASCAVPTLKAYTEFNSEPSTFSNPYFADSSIDYVYKAKINAFDNVFGGILIIKKIKENNHRVVFTTNFGNKIFDFELINNTVKTHFVLKEIDRKIIINALKRDFKTLIQQHHTVSRTFKNDLNIIYKSKAENKFNYLIVSKGTEVLNEIIHASKSKEKIRITFSNLKNHLAQTIKIEHKTAPITINLEYLNTN